MFSIDLTIRYSPVPISVQKNEESDAKALYEEILAAMTAETPKVIELTSDKEEGRKIAVVGNQINSVIFSANSNSAKSGKVPGFFATTPDK
jgi:hypothetical protein